MSAPPPRPPDEPSTPEPGIPGASARREHERRRANRERRIRQRHPRLGGAILALSDEPQHQRAWHRGAGGEERVAARLAKGAKDGVVLLHDRRLPLSRGNIDHLAVAPSGVWVIDAKRYEGKVAVVKPFFGDAKLTIRGRDRTKLIDGLARQVDAVQRALADTDPNVAVQGALCFVDAELPVLRGLSLRGFPLLYPRGMAKRLNRPGPLSPQDIQAVAARLSVLFPSA